MDGCKRFWDEYSFSCGDEGWQCPDCVAKLEAELATAGQGLLGMYGDNEALTVEIERLRIERNGAFNRGLETEEWWATLKSELKEAIARHAERCQCGTCYTVRRMSDIETAWPEEEGEK